MPRIARRRSEEERAEALFLCERRRTRRAMSAIPATRSVAVKHVQLVVPVLHGIRMAARTAAEALLRRCRVLGRLGQSPATALEK
jgi:hypothetical protein